MPELQERLALKCDIDPDGCWVWHASSDSRGYGLIRIDRVLKMAHRVSYELFVGPIPPKMELDHLCRNRACIRPDHLEPVTHKENVQRGWAARAKS